MRRLTSAWRSRDKKMQVGSGRRQALIRRFVLRHVTGFRQHLDGIYNNRGRLLNFY